MPGARYFKLHESVGVEPPYVTDPKTGEPVANPKAGELQPLAAQKLTVAVPTIVKTGGSTEPIMVAREVELPDPKLGTIADPAERVWAITDPTVANAFSQLDIYREVDPVKSTKAAKE